LKLTQYQAKKHNPPSKQYKMPFEGENPLTGGKNLLSEGGPDSCGQVSVLGNAKD
jgi:hypothetical protein